MIRPSVFRNYDVIAAQSTRYARDCNSSHDNEEKLAFLDELDIRESDIASSKQVHGNEVLVADHAQRAEGYDAIITNKKGLFVMVATADCTPVLIYDKANNAVAAIHAGWRGTVAKIVTATLEKMNKLYGTLGENCLAFIGACICEKTFEVGPEVAGQFGEDVKRFDKTKDKYFVDLKKANYLQLADFGVPEENIETCPYCTIEDNDKFYSYRKEKGKTGRMYSIIGMK